MLDILGQQYPKRSIGVQKVSGLDDSHRHALAILTGDLLQPGGSVERLRAGFLDRESSLRALGQDVDDGAEFVRAIIVSESAAMPQASVGATDLGSSLMDRAATALALVFARDATELRQLADTKHRAAQRTCSADTVGRILSAHVFARPQFERA